MDTNEFHNPYSFVPARRDDRKDDLDRKAFEGEETPTHPHVTHDRYGAGCHSGRIICRLITESPVFIGGRRKVDATETTPAEVEPYELLDDGGEIKRPAIPASTLRGLLSSLAEAASNSALRVLEDETYVFKQAIKTKTGYSFPKEAVKDSKTGETATSYSFFKQIDSELLPFNSERNVITLAEQLFGFVEDVAEGKKDSALGLAGRVYPSPARLAGFRKGNNEWEETNKGLGSPYQGLTTLKILSSPKPPSPAMYFKTAQGNPAYISKQALDPQLHHPQGRKFYLHHKKGGLPWKSESKEHMDQKAIVNPVRQRAVFYFHLDFDNLSERELALLLYVLRPSEEFRHKVGMGKSIGLGTVKIDVVGMFLIDRAGRYSAEGLFSPRYAEVWRDDADANDWPIRYERERMVQGGMLKKSVEQLRVQFGDSMDREIKHALELIGNPAALQAPVHTPTVEGQPPEDETFLWFVENDKPAQKNKQFLAPLKSQLKLPTLKKHKGKQG